MLSQRPAPISRLGSGPFPFTTTTTTTLGPTGMKRRRDDLDSDSDSHPDSNDGSNTTSGLFSNITVPTKRTRPVLPSDAEGLTVSPPTSSRPVPSMATFPLRPAAPISSFPCLSRTQFPSLTPSSSSPTTTTAPTFDNSDRSAPGRSLRLLLIPGPDRTDQHIFAVCAVLPHLLSLSPSLQPFILDPHSHIHPLPQGSGRGSSSDVTGDDADVTPSYPVPTVDISARTYPNPLVHLGVLHPSGGTVSASTMPAIVLVDHHHRRRLVIPVGWGAGARWRIRPARRGTGGGGGGGRQRHHQSDPLADLAADPDAAETARRLLGSLVRAVGVLEREAAVDQPTA